MWRVVLDTSVLVAALRSGRGASAALLALVADRFVTPLISTPLLYEYEDVLKRSQHRHAVEAVAGGADGFLAALASASEAVEIYYRWRPQVRDPADEMVLETAINGRADALVTHNLRDFGTAGKTFGILVIPPGDALKRCRV
jgi:putative PIN family toxin of toxin-antitoxin system